MILKTYKFRIYPNKTQEGLIRKSIGCVRYIYNKGLESKTKAYNDGKKKVTWIDLCNTMLMEEKEKNPWLKETYSQSLQSGLRNLDVAFTNFFKKRSGFPVYKKKRNGGSFQYPQGVKVDLENNKIILPKLGKVNIVFHRPIIDGGKIKTTTVRMTPTGKFFVSILIEYESLNYPNKKSINRETTIGLDLGIKHFTILSTGEKIENPKLLQKYIKKLRYYQKLASKKQKDSKNRIKANRKVALIYEKIANSRRDFHCKLASRLVRENQTICIEDLSTKEMLMRGNRHLSRSIGDCGWSQFVSILEHKCLENGVNLLKIGRFEPSSKTCSCGVVNNALLLSDRKWTCSSCGLNHDRDILAANNIKTFALANAYVEITGLERPSEPMELNDSSSTMK